MIRKCTYYGLCEVAERAERADSPISKPLQRWLPALKRLARFRGAHAGEDCFILGNGPSLNRTDLESLAGKHVFGLNKIYLLTDRRRVTLSYVVAVNPFVLEQASERLGSMGVPVFVPVDLAPRIRGRSPHFVPIRATGAFEFAHDLFGNFAQGHTVTFVALQLAFAMGFERVFLAGVDHNFRQNGSANETQRMEGDDPNHFDPDYFKGNDWQLADLEGSELAYRIADFHYRRAGRRIVDATVGGKLDLFEKMDFEEAVEACRDRRRNAVRFGDATAVPSPVPEEGGSGTSGAKGR